MTKATFQLETLSCPSCVHKIEAAMKKTPGMQKAEVLFNSARMKAEFDGNILTADKIIDRLEALGYQVLSVK